MQNLKLPSLFLTNAGLEFQGLIDCSITSCRVLSGLTWKTCLVYLDDIIIFSRTFENHLANLREVFERLKEAHLKLSPKKCHFFNTEPIPILLASVSKIKKSSLVGYARIWALIKACFNASNDF
jgi:hypothetical protein